MSDAMRPLRFTAAVCLTLFAAFAIAIGSAWADEVTPSTPPPAEVEPALDGIKLGENPAAVLARLGLHPPGWARSAGAAAEGRSFTTDGKKATMVLLFDKTIERITVKTNEGSPSIADAYGIKLGESLTDLIAARGAPIAIKAGATYVYGDPAAIRWEYDITDGKVSAISVADCRIPGVCEPLQNG
jgi:hypothetical protein